MKTFDCIVIGGGMVGAASALSLAELGLAVAVVEKHAPADFSPEQVFDLRVSAISLSSIHLLEQLHAWRQITQWRSCAYQRLGVWEYEFCYTEFNAEDIQQKNLGTIVENRLIQLSLWQQMKVHPKVTLFCPDTLKNFTQCDDHVSVELERGELSAKLLIAADGANSQVRELADIGMTGWDYQQSAMLINVETELAQQDITWQKFFQSGPVAMLPLPGVSTLGGNASLVWYHHKDEIKRLSSLSNQQLKQEIITHFPSRLGNVNVIDKAAFPLTRRHANRYQKNRVILIGDAAHTINPMAGQGVNLGFKDVKALQSVIASAIGNNECWHQPSTLARYEKTRRHDNLLMMTTMDVLYASFSHPSPFVKVVRNAGLFVAKHTPLLKNKALAYACGI
ncbi:MAG: 2-octaprenyl-3-methyl-6-methoxy-1,4-benzoquinol hydroxylase [Alteromonadaceae bacterium]|jgi:2-octaprenyl-3-methyl-6-methoxy-1,4-benzoquinol hydroxylase